MAEPKFPLTHDHTEVKIRPHAAYAKVILKDADGKFWQFEGASFYFDMAQVEPPSDAASESAK